MLYASQSSRRPPSGTPHPGG